jgi:transposase
MADATLQRSEIATVRRLVETCGIYEAAKRLGVHVSTINIILAGREPRRATIVSLRASIPKVKA